MHDAPAQIDSTVNVVTPENIAFQYQTAGPFRRIWAFLIDMGIRAWWYFQLFWGIGVLLSLVGLPGFGWGVYLIMYFVIDWFYGGVWETYMNGQTPGKWLLGIRVLTTQGTPINGKQAVMRNVLRSVEFMPLLSLEIFGVDLPIYWIPTFMLGLLCMACNPRYQRLGDLVCGTIVIIEEKHWLTGVAKLEDPRTIQLAAYLPMDFVVGRPMAKALAHYVDRRRFFSVERRREVAKHLARPLLERFGLPADTSHDLLLCALYYRTFIADQRDDDRQFEENYGTANPFGLTLEQSLQQNAEAGAATIGPMTIQTKRKLS